MEFTENGRLPDGGPRSHPPASSRRELFAQAAALFEGEGTVVGADVEALMKPLLDGTMGFAEHHAMLEAMLKDLGA